MKQTKNMFTWRGKNDVKKSRNLCPHKKDGQQKIARFAKETKNDWKFLKCNRNQYKLTLQYAVKVYVNPLRIKML